jgi:hypothetical protein
VLAANWRTLGGSGNLGGGEIGHQKKEQGVAGDVEIEVDQTVHQESGASDKAGKMERGGEGLVLQEQPAERMKKQSTEKPGTTRGAGNSSFG